MSTNDYQLSQTAAGHKLSLRECVRKGNPLAAFDEFIMAWVDPKWHAHLMDNDDNDAQWVRDAIRDVWQSGTCPPDESVGPLDEYRGQ